MKKTYISPDTDMLLIATQQMIAVSGFEEKLDDNPIETKDMLSRRRKTVWDDEEEEEEDF